MTTPAERRQRTRLHWWHRGRADAVAAIANELRWTEGHTYAVARRIHVDAGDLHEALTRRLEDVS